MPPFDTAKPNIARVWDYWLGGKDNFAADRELARRMLDIYPLSAQMARENRQFLGRAVGYVVISVGTGAENAVAVDFRAACTAAPLHFHTPSQVLTFFDGLELVPPGVAPVRGWAAEAPVPELEPRQGSFLAGVGIKFA